MSNYQIQKRIEENIRRKELREQKTNLSIQISWAINNAVNFVPEKLKGKKEGFNLVKKWFPKFIDLYREWMMENIPTELLDGKSKIEKLNVLDNIENDGYEETKIEEEREKISNLYPADEMKQIEEANVELDILTNQEQENA